MSVTIQDYDRAVQGLVNDLQPLGKDLLSVMLYGSIAQGTASPGRSDLDAQVFLRAAALQHRDTFLAALRTMVKAGRSLAASGVPCEHPAGYTAQDEIVPLMAVYFPSFLALREGRTTDEVRFVAGEDLRGSVAEPPSWETGLIESLRSFVYPYAGYLSEAELSPEDRGAVAALLQSIRKFVPPSACAGAGEPAVGVDAHRILARLFPDLDVAVLDEVAALKHSQGDLPRSEVLKTLLKRCFVLMEELHRRTTKGAGT